MKNIDKTDIQITLAWVSMILVVIALNYLLNTF